MTLGLLYVIIALVILIIYITEWSILLAEPSHVIVEPVYIVEPYALDRTNDFEPYAPNNREFQENSQSYWSSRIDDSHSTNFEQTNSQIYFD